MDDIGTHAVKIGMLHSPDVIKAVADRLAHWHSPNLVVDPVMISKSGDKLLLDDAVDALGQILLPMATLITPNLPEASVLLNRPVNTPEDMHQAARDLADLGPANVLVKGGHLAEDQSVDLLFTPATGRMVELPATRINTPNSHGTGCTLSSAIAAGLAKGQDIESAVSSAKAYITDALTAGADFATGSGHGPVHHFYNLWK
jgi:hydroxymethylpyrimidine/phosphomethylpyrimidine kinase